MDVSECESAVPLTVTRVDARLSVGSLTNAGVSDSAALAPTNNTECMVVAAVCVLLVIPVSLFLSCFLLLFLISVRFGRFGGSDSVPPHCSLLSVSHPSHWVGWTNVSRSADTTTQGEKQGGGGGQTHKTKHPKRGTDTISAKQ